MGKPSDEHKLCAACGETDPYPRHFCIVKLDRAACADAAKNRRCSYSLEAGERMRAKTAGRAQEIPDAE